MLSKEDRQYLHKWYSDVSNQRNLPPTVLNRAIYLADLYLSLVPQACKNPLILNSTALSRQMPIYVIGGVILDIAAKVDGIKLMPSVILCFKCSNTEMLDLEFQILDAFNWYVQMPTAMDIAIALMQELLYNARICPIEKATPKKI